MIINNKHYLYAIKKRIIDMISTYIEVIFIFLSQIVTSNKKGAAF